jgi:hypothetical protein
VFLKRAPQTRSAPIDSERRTDNLPDRVARRNFPAAQKSLG